MTDKYNLSKTPYLYEISCNDYDSHEHVTYAHSKKLSRRYFMSILQRVFIRVLKKIAKPRSHYPHLRSPSYLDILNEHTKDPVPGEVFCSRLITIELEKYGFVEVDFTRRFYGNGNTNPLTPESNEDYFSKKLRKQYKYENPKYSSDIKIGEAREVALRNRRIKKRAEEFIHIKDLRTGI